MFLQKSSHLYSEGLLALGVGGEGMEVLESDLLGFLLVGLLGFLLLVFAGSIRILYCQKKKETCDLCLAFQCSQMICQNLECKA